MPRPISAPGPTKSSIRSLPEKPKGARCFSSASTLNLVASVQGVTPANCYVVAPWTDFEPQAVSDGRLRGVFPARPRRDDRSHCTRWTLTRFVPILGSIARFAVARTVRRAAAGGRSSFAGRRRLEAANRGTEAARRSIRRRRSAAMPLPLSWKPSRGAAASYERVREQARIQVEGREAGKLLHEFLPVTPGFGLACLPPPSHGDMFFDLEGDPFVGEGGLEYLFGYVYARPTAPSSILRIGSSRVTTKSRPSSASSIL